jgi:uncharacterized membrane protein YqjE
VAADREGRSLPVRVLRLGARVGQRYAETAQREAIDDSKRLVYAGLLAGLGLVAGAHLLAVLHVLVLFLAMDAGIDVTMVLGAFAVFDGVIALGLGLAARSSLSKPVLAKTRAHLIELAALLSDAT